MLASGTIYYSTNSEDFERTLEVVAEAAYEAAKVNVPVINVSTGSDLESAATGVQSSLLGC